MSLQKTKLKRSRPKSGQKLSSRKRKATDIKGPSSAHSQGSLSKEPSQVGRGHHKKIQKPGVRLGILGGGQLAQMMALAAHPYGIQPQIYSASKDEPAALVTPNHFRGSPQESAALEKFLKACDVVTFESEFMDAGLLETLSQKVHCPVFPSPRLMGLWQDRLSQKQLLETYKIPTAPFKEVKQWDDLSSKFFDSNEIVIKQRRFGYDGYGTFFLNLKNGREQWLEIEQISTEGFIAEKKIPFRRELALLLARDQFGTVIDFPLVESRQTKARCDWVMGPVKHAKEPALRRALKKMIEKENYVGVIAFELFDTGRDLLVNEVAPRVHNSGHYSQEALSLDQFEAHVLAVCGYELPQPKILSPFAMANLLGESSEKAHWPSNIIPSKTTAFLHWYNKKENRPHRKMGHINALGTTSKKALETALQLRKKVKR